MKIFRLPQYGTGSSDLGDYIFISNPYGAVPPPATVWLMPFPPPVLEVADTDPKDGALYYLDSTGIEVHERPGKWTFKYADHYVHRGLRIPYMYYKDSGMTETDAQGVVRKKLALVRDYFLIGFEGGVAY